MGNAEVLPLANSACDIGYVAIILRQNNKVLVLYPTPEVRLAIYNIVK